jgi:hypothetical protein
MGLVLNGPDRMGEVIEFASILCDHAAADGIVAELAAALKGSITLPSTSPTRARCSSLTGEAGRLA